MKPFDRFSNLVAKHVARSYFFVFCVLLVVLWGPSILLIGNVDTWQLIINTVTTIITFLMVALLHNDQQRFETAVHAKLDALAKAQAYEMEWIALWLPDGKTYDRDVYNHLFENMKKRSDELLKAVGIEEETSA